MRQGLLLVVLVAVGVLGVAASANATIVFEHDSQIWAVNDDGSSPRTLATGAPLGMERGLGHPHVAPNGTVVVFDGTTNRNYNTSCNGTIHYGLGATGVYRWSAGQVARITPDPQQYSCGSDFETEPEATTDGRVDYGYFGCNGYVSGQIGSYNCLNRIWSNDLNGGGFAELPSCSGAESPSPNPADPAEFASVGCTSGNYVVARTKGNSTQVMAYDDAQQKDPSWRSDGQRAVAVEGGGDPGIWDYNRDIAANNLTYVLAQPNGVEFRSPRYMGAGQDKILFSANGELWTIPANCGLPGSPHQPCQFPGDATQLTSSGSNRDPAWTAQTIAAPAQSTNNPPPTTHPTTTPGGGTTTTNPGGSGGTVRGIFTSAVRVSGKATSRNGVTIALALARATTVRFVFYRVTRTGRGRVVVEAGLKRIGSAKKSGRAGANRFRFRKVGGKRLKRGSYTVKITAAGVTKRVSFKVKR